MSDGLDPTSLGTHAGTGLLGGLSLLVGQMFVASRRSREEEKAEETRDDRMKALEVMVAALDKKIDRLLDRDERRDKDEDHRDAMLEEVRRELAEVDKRLSRLEDRAAPRTGEFTKAGP